MHSSSMIVGFILGLAIMGILQLNCAGAQHKEIVACEDLCANNGGVYKLYLDVDCSCNNGAEFNSNLVFDKVHER